MKNSEQIKKQIADMESDLADALVENLNRIGRNFNTDDEDDYDTLEFFGYENTGNQGIRKINSNGTMTIFSHNPNGEEFTIQTLIDDDIIPVYDAVVLLTQLEELH